MVLLSFVYDGIEKDHIKIALPLLYCTYFAGLLLFRQSTKSIRKREKSLSVYPVILTGLLLGTRVRHGPLFSFTGFPQN